MVNEPKILEEFDRWFVATRIIEEKLYDFDDEGRLDVYESVVPRLYSFPKNRLPFKFGKIAGDLNLRECGLTTLDGAPYSVSGYCLVDRNRLTSLEGGPQIAQGGYNISKMKTLKSLEGFPAETNEVIFTWYPHLPLLRLLGAKKLVPIYDGVPFESTYAEMVRNILKKYAGQGRAGAFDCRRELRAAGFEDNARW